MNLLFRNKFIRTSSKNGSIYVVQTWFGDWAINVGGYNQTTPYLHKMWGKSFKHVQKLQISPIRNILMLGLAAGGEIKNLHIHFPDCSITAVEYDPEMVKLTKEIKLYEPYDLPTILEGDAKDVVPTLKEKFDLIMVDIFSGAEPSALLLNKEFQQALKERLVPQGLMVVNVYLRTDYLDSIAETITEVSRFKSKLNFLGVFRA